jgi:hypothetical protein
MKPTLNPRNLHFWLKDYEKEANAKFGDASIFIFTDVEPLYKEDNFEVYLKTKLKIGDDEFNGIHEDLWKLEQKHWFYKRTDYAEKLFEMFNDMILHSSLTSPLI